MILMSAVQVYVVDTGKKGVRKIARYLKDRGLLEEKERRIEVRKDEILPNPGLLLEVGVIGMEDKIPLVLNGCGDDHMFTFSFCLVMVDMKKNPYPYTIIAVDGHEDGILDIRPRRDFHSGNFFSRLLEKSLFAQAAIFVTDVGIPCVNEKGKVAYLGYWNSDVSRIVDKVLENIKTDSIYISVDLDVLSGEYVSTDYGNFGMKLSFLLSFLEGLISKKKVVGADICGIKKNGAVSTGLFGRIREFLRLPSNKKSLETYASVYLALLNLLSRQQGSISNK